MRLKLEQLEARETPSASGIYAIGSGVGGPPRVKVFSNINHNLLADFLAYEPTFGGGVNVAVGDVTNDGIPDVTVGAGQGGGPRVRVLDGRALVGTAGFPQAPRNNTLISNAVVVADFFAFEVAQRGGVYVTSGNITGSANAEVIVGAGPGGGPRARIFNGNAIATQRTSFNTLQPGDVSADFFAFESNFRNGVLVSVSPSLPSATAQYLTVTPGSGGSPRVRVLSGPAITLQTVSYNTTRPGDVVADFFSGNPGLRGGAFVSTADYNRDGTSDVAVGTGPGATGIYTIYSGARIREQGQSFTGNQVGDVLFTSFVGPGGYSNGVAIGSSVVANTALDGLLLVGFGGGVQGLTGRAQLIRFNLGANGLTPEVLNEVTIDTTFRAVVFTGN